MKTSFFGLGLAVLVASAKATNYDVASCAELADIDDTTTVTSLTITSTPIECDSYTRFSVVTDLTVKSNSTVVFKNFALEVLVGGGLTVEPDVVFYRVTDQDVDGGAVFVDTGAATTFLGQSIFLENSVLSTSSENPRKGGAIHNKGALAFEGNASFLKNEVRAPDSTDWGRGGAIYNSASGTIAFNAELLANENKAEGSLVGQGGAIYNEGNIVVEGKSVSTDNSASDGGSIYIDEDGTMTFNDYAIFAVNDAYDLQGGAIATFGSLNLMGGSLFQSNYASSSGDGGRGGGIYNGAQASLSFGGDNTFDDNWGYLGGAIYNGLDASISFPQDGGEIIFQNPHADESTCPSIYYEQQDGTYICGP